jgi:hypothetical protein
MQPPHSLFRMVSSHLTMLSYRRSVKSGSPPSYPVSFGPAYEIYVSFPDPP